MIRKALTWWKAQAQAAAHTVFVFVALSGLLWGYGEIRAGRRSWTSLEPCVRVRPVPATAGGVGEKEVSWGAGLTNKGKVGIHLDSVSWGVYSVQIPRSASVPIKLREFKWPDTLDAGTYAGKEGKGWDLQPQVEAKRLEILILPTGDATARYKFEMAFVYKEEVFPFIAKKGRVAFERTGWLESFPDICRWEQ